MIAADSIVLLLAVAGRYATTKVLANLVATWYQQQRAQI